MKVCVIGLGEVGFPTAKYVMEKGFVIWGYDKDPNAVGRAIERGLQKATSNWSEVPPADIYIICVTTKIEGNLPDQSAVFDVCEKIYKKSSEAALVSIESTIIPGTCKRIWEDIFDQRVNLVHVPHRYWPKEPEAHGVNQMRVIGSIDKESMAEGLDFYSKGLKIPLHPVSSIEVAELCKISENAYRFVQIAFSEELRMISEELGINPMEVRDACNTKWNVELPEARDGIGGACLPKDTKYLASLSKKHTHLLKGAMTADDEYKQWLSQNSSSKISISLKDEKHIS